MYRYEYTTSFRGMAVQFMLVCTARAQCTDQYALGAYLGGIIVAGLQHLYDIYILPGGNSIAAHSIRS